MLTLLTGIGFVGGAVSLAVLGCLLARRYLPSEVLVQHHDISSVFFQVIGTFYAVLLGFIVLVVWNGYNSAQDIVAREANQVGNVYRYAEPFADPGRLALQSTILAYGQAVVEDEWPRLASGHTSPRVSALLVTAWRQAVALESPTAELVQLKAVLVQRIDELDDARAERVNAAQPTVSLFFWAMLSAGAVVVVCFSYLFRLKATGSQMVMSGALALVMALICFMILTLDQPFDGEVKVDPGPFIFELSEIEAGG